MLTPSPSYAALCASHSPLALKQPELEPAFFAAMGRAGSFVAEFEPDLVIAFAPDHFNGLFYDMMPNFCLGGRATSVGDWGTPEGALAIPEDLARQALDFVRARDIDLDFSLDLKVDHGLTQMWAMMGSGLPAYPILPIVINCAAPPRPTLRRARQLGAALGAFAASLGKRVLFTGSGGLSHDPPIPQLDTASPLQLELIMARRNQTMADRLDREAWVMAAAASFQSGTGGAVAPDPEWDQLILQNLAKDVTRFDAWDDATVSAKGGFGGHEIRTWVAAIAGIEAAAGGYRFSNDYYAVIDAWLTGMCVAHAVADGAGPVAGPD